jgi:hypothetical protein
MRVECPRCKKILSVPDDYKNKRIKCKYCEQVLEAVPLEAKTVVPTNIMQKPEVPEKSSEYKLRPSQGNFITKIWTKSPAAFRNAFLATLGVVSALVLSIYIYGNIWHLNPENLDWAQKKLALHKLFLTEPMDGQIEIFRGRNLTKYNFSADATRFDIYLAVWADNKNNIVGISACWTEDTNHPFFPHPSDDFTEWFCNDKVRDGFEELTGWNLIGSLYAAQRDGKFHTAKNDLTEESYGESCKKWSIIITRWKITGSKYAYLATAQTW